MIDENVSSASLGGCLRLVPDWYSIKKKNFTLNNSELYNLIETNRHVHEIYLKASQVIIFKGDVVLHSVSKMREENNKRVTLLYAWDDVNSSKTVPNDVAIALYGSYSTQILAYF